MAKIGTTSSQREQLESKSSVFEDVHEFDKGDNIFRFFQGPQKANVVFYPTIIELEENGEKKIKSTYRALSFLEIPPIINSIQKAETSVRQQLGDKGEIGFRVQTRWWYLAINLKDEGNYMAKPIKVPKSVKDKITELETKLDVKDPDYLLNGMFYLYDILVEKKIDPSKKSKKYGTSYDTSIYGQNKWMTRIPKALIKEPADVVINQLGGMVEVFGEEITAAIEDCEIDLEKVIEPMDDVRIRELLTNFPINLLGRKSSDHSLSFPQTPAFQEMIEALGLPTVSIDFAESGEISKEIPTHAEEPSSGGIKNLKVPKEEPTEEKEPEKEPEAPEVKDEDSTSSEVKETPSLKDAPKIKPLKKGSW